MRSKTVHKTLFHRNSQQKYYSEPGVDAQEHFAPAYVPERWRTICHARLFLLYLYG